MIGYFVSIHDVEASIKKADHLLELLDVSPYFTEAEKKDLREVYTDYKTTLEKIYKTRKNEQSFKSR